MNGLKKNSLNWMNLLTKSPFHIPPGARSNSTTSPESNLMQEAIWLMGFFAARTKCIRVVFLCGFRSKTQQFSSLDCDPQNRQTFKFSAATACPSLGLPLLKAEQVQDIQGPAYRNQLAQHNKETNFHFMVSTKSLGKSSFDNRSEQPMKYQLSSLNILYLSSTLNLASLR